MAVVHGPFPLCRCCSQVRWAACLKQMIESGTRSFLLVSVLLSQASDLQLLAAGQLAGGFLQQLVAWAQQHAHLEYDARQTLVPVLDDQLSLSGVEHESRRGRLHVVDDGSAERNGASRHMLRVLGALQLHPDRVFGHVPPRLVDEHLLAGAKCDVQLCAARG